MHDRLCCTKTYSHRRKQFDDHFPSLTELAGCRERSPCQTEGSITTMLNKTIQTVTDAIVHATQSAERTNDTLKFHHNCNGYLASHRTVAGVTDKYM